MELIPLDSGKPVPKKMIWGSRIVDLLCDCEGCARLGGVTVAYQGISQIAKPDDLKPLPCN